MAALLAAGPGALVSHRTALRLWGLDRRPDTPIEVTIPRGRSHASPPTICHESRDLSLAKPVLIDGIRVTGLVRTLIDLGAVEPWRVRWAIWAARRTHDLAWEDMARALRIHARPGRRGTGPFRRVLEQHYGEIATDSGTEDLAYAILFDCGRVPIPVKQLPITLPNGITVHADLGWPLHKVVLEIQGVDHFTNEDLQQLDLRRRNQLELAGYRVLLYSGRSVRKDPDRFVAEVRSILAKNPPIP
jgi:hypothetical protein